MSWPDDPYALEELRGQTLFEAHEILEQLAHGKEGEAEKAGERVSMSNSCIARLAREVSEKIIADDPMVMAGDKLNGEQLYDTRKLTNVVHSTVETVLDEHRAAGTIEAEEAAKAKRYLVDIFTSRGRRSKMEDRHVAFTDFNALMGLKGMEPQAFFGVYDGHGGVEAAKFTQAQLHCNIVAQETFKEDVSKALVDGFLETDRQFLRKADRDALGCGATACTALVRGRKLHVAWLGDSQVMMCRGGEVVELMQPHKPEREDEKQRINDADGVVVWYGAWRVNGVLSVARAIGDKKLKQWVIGRPDTAEFDIDEQCEYLILGCDGLFDMMDLDKIVSFIREWREKNDEFSGIAKALVEHCIGSLAGTDNISIVIVFLRDLKSDGWTKVVEEAD